MKNILSVVNGFVMSCLLLITTAGASFAASYSFTYLTNTPAYGINNADIVVGGGGAFWIFDGSSYTYPPDQPAGQNIAWDINDAGVIAGDHYDGTWWRAFTYDGSSYSYLNVPGSLFTVVLGISNDGHVVGYYVESGTGYHGFIYDGTSFTTLDVPGAPDTRVVGINDTGIVTGIYLDNASKWHSYTYDGSSFTYLDVPGADHTEASGINKSGTIVGDYRDSSGIHGFIYDGTSFTTLDVPGSPGTIITDINNAGTMVGWYSDTDSIFTNGFIAKPSSDLPDLIMTKISTGILNKKANAGSTVLVNDTVMNQGNSLAGGFTVAYHLSVDSIYGNGDDIVTTTTRTVYSLNGGASNAWTTGVVIPIDTPPGTYYMCAKADDGGTVAETNEDNNWMCHNKTITVPKPDLVVSVFANFNLTATAGGTILVIDSTKNQGGSQALNFDVGYVLSTNGIIGDGDDILLPTTRSLTSLGVNTISTVSTHVTIPFDVPAGTYNVGAIADVSGVVDELKEGNNTLRASNKVTISP